MLSEQAQKVRPKSGVGPADLLVYLKSECHFELTQRMLTVS
jgi:hypothetical protein